MKKIKCLLIAIPVFTFVVGYLIASNFNQEGEVIASSTSVTSVVSTGNIAMMLETGAGTSEYYISTDTTWPDESEYTFNATLSKCENGSTLTWDSDNDQVLMTGTKSDKCYVYFDVYIQSYSVEDVCSSGENFANCIISLYDATGDGTVGLYFHDGSVNYYSYGKYYSVTNYKTGETTLYQDFSYYATSEVSWTDGYCQSVDGEVFYYGDVSVDTEGECVGTSYELEEDTTYYLGIEVIYKYSDDMYSTTYDAGDYSYRYSGESDQVSNFVCFGSSESTCPNESLYRIIGLFKNASGNYEVKLVKWDYASVSLLGSGGDYYRTSTNSLNDYQGYLTSYDYYYWNASNYDNTYSSTGYYNVWSYSKLNTYNLNQYYLTQIGTTWSNMIVDHIWSVGGAPYGSNSAYVYYVNEIINPSTQVETTYTDKIGLIYVSDYLYTYNPGTWSSNVSDYTLGWLYMSDVNEYSITRDSGSISNGGVYAISIEGASIIVDGDGGGLIRPTFYLSSSVKYSGGDGSYSNPYRITL